MKGRTTLGEAILKHWREHRPEMVSALAKDKRLNQAVLEAQEATAELLYELVNVKKMDYQAAWEIATTEYAFLPSEARPPGRWKRTTPPRSKRSRPRRRGTSA